MLALLSCQSRWCMQCPDPGSRAAAEKSVGAGSGPTAFWRGVAEAEDVDDTRRFSRSKRRGKEFLPSGTSSSPLSVAMIAVCSDMDLDHKHCLRPRIKESKVGFVEGRGKSTSLAGRLWNPVVMSVDWGKKPDLMLSVCREQMNLVVEGEVCCLGVWRWVMS